MKKLALLASIALLALPGLALAQTSTAASQSYIPPALPNTTQTDLLQDIPGGNPAVGNKYVTIGQVAGAPSYVFNVPLTGFSLTFANNQDWFILNPATTPLATGSIALAPVPSDAQRNCIVDSTGAVTALTVTASSGQTVVGAPTALAAGASVCFTYVASQATWFKS
jgi:hypothetical protein